jgi:glycosyltransferase involved in cell wall biosynthesis
MRIAAVTIEGLVNAIYRAFVPLEELARRGHTVHVEERNELRSWEVLREFDVVYFWRHYDDAMRRTARRLQEAGVAVVWDNDDDLTQIPKGNPGYLRVGGLRGQRVFAEMAQMMRLADVVTTTSPVLAERYGEASGADVRVIENYLPQTFLRTPQPPSENVVIGWLAALEHQIDYEQLHLRETFQRVLDRHADVHIVSIGLGLGLPSERYHHLPITRYGDLPGLLGQFDIGIAPLVDIPFNRARSNVKLKEYAAVGVPWLASPVGSYAGMGEREGGWLVEDDAWEEGLEQLIADEAARRRLTTAASGWASRQTIRKNADAWETVFSDAIERAARREGAAARA